MAKQPLTRVCAKALNRGEARRRGSLEQARAELSSRLRARWSEIEGAAMARLYGISQSPDFPNPEYTEGLRSAASAALEYLLAGVGDGEGQTRQPPAAVLVQARLAARNGVSLDTVLRRCFAGYTLFGDFLMQEAEEGELLQSAALKRLLRAQAALFERLIAMVTEEYTREAERRLDSGEQRRVELIHRLLAGELLDTSDLDYDFDAHHLGAIAAGPGAVEAIQDLSRLLDRRLLLIRCEEETAWAWLGGRRPLDLDQLQHGVSSAWAPGVSLAIGEPGVGRLGWRLTHQQAKAALPIAIRTPETPIRYREVALLASMLQDDLLTTSLRELYLLPLERERDGGEVLRETLRAYFAAERNASSAAAALGVSRRTVTTRLRTVEARLGRPLNSAMAEIEAALRFEELEIG